MLVVGLTQFKNVDFALFAVLRVLLLLMPVATTVLVTWSLFCFSPRLCIVFRAFAPFSVPTLVYLLHVVCIA